MAVPFEALLAQLGSQHKRFLSEVAASSVEGLRRDNERLQEEVSALRRKVGGGGSPASALQPRKAPPLPPVPPSPPCLVALPGSVSAVCGGPDAVAQWNSDESAACPRGGADPVALWTTEQATPRDGFRPGCNGHGLPKAPLPPDAPRPFVSGSVPAGPWPASAPELDDRRQNRERRRLRWIFGLEGNREKNPQVSPHAVHQALDHRQDYAASMGLDRVAAVLRAIAHSHTQAAGSRGSLGTLDNGSSVSLTEMLDAIWSSETLARLAVAVHEDAEAIFSALRESTAEEIIHEASRTTYESIPEDGEEVSDSMSSSHMVATPSTAMLKSRSQRKWLRRVNWVVSVTVVLNMFCMAISVDKDPEHIGWLLLETVCLLVFICEMVVKGRFYGAHGFFCGELGTWNASDLTITLFAFMQVLVEWVARLPSFQFGGKEVTKTLKVAVMLRSLRLVRVVRLVKLVRSPIMRDLANMLVGFVIGIPSLLWVLLFFLATLLLEGLLFRMAFGNERGRELGYYQNLCGPADDILDSEGECQVHFVYGEEFFGTVHRSMFTTFRWTLGDFGTRGGKSLVVAFSQEYGLKFDSIFVCFMIVVIFGLFNIITAIFVETTVAGLKHNDVKRKYQQQYERIYVKGKLHTLMGRIAMITQELCLAPQTSGQIVLDEEMFSDVVDDPLVKSLLGDLDVEVFNLPAMFSTFDGDDSGRVNIQEFMEGIMKLRGEPQKVDIIGVGVSTKLLHAKVDELRGLVVGGRPTDLRAGRCNEAGKIQQPACC